MMKGFAFARPRLLGQLAWAAVLWGAGSVHAADSRFDAAALEHFEKSVRPILVERCLNCHGPDKQKGGLRLDSRESILKGGESGPAAVPGKPGESLLVDAVNYGETVQMPPKSRLPASEVTTLTRWVSGGLAWAPSHGSVSGSSSTPSKNAFDLKARAASHWAWRPVKPQQAPAVNDTSWPLGPIDRFILARLEAKGLKPAPDADRLALIRRLTFDLTGLPPTPADLDAFLRDQEPGAYERLVDRLLASPRFGERWGRHWLDLVRYAESRGHEFDPILPNAWRYRDYVVRALNADVPYDQFLAEHIAGDLLERPRLDPTTNTNESILATGFWFLGEEVHSPVDIRQDETDRLDNRLDVMAKTFLGLTVACARCHDHKFDAISQRDYYALSGFLISSTYRQARFATIEGERASAIELQALRDQARPRLLALAANAARPGVERLAATLLHALPLMPRADVQGNTLSASVESKTGSAAHATWAEELGRARTDQSHPFHAFVSASDKSNRVNKPWDRPVADDRASRLVVDFGALEDLARHQDGSAYGLRPVRAGDLRLGSTAGTIDFGLHTRAAAAREGAAVHLTTASGDERDHGRLGTWDRSGQTLRTPDFTLRSGRLWYLAEGGGRAYAAVNSHLVIAGPLHGATLTEWSGGGKRWRWVRHELGAYKGHRLHVEFCPPKPGASAIARVVDSESEPPLPGPVAETLTGDPADPPGVLASSYQDWFIQVIDRMRQDRVVGAPDSPAFAAAADWLMSHLDLLAPNRSPERDAWDAERARAAGAVRDWSGRVSSAASVAPAMLDGNGVDEHLLIRGSSKAPGPEVPRRFLEAIAGDQPVACPDGPGGSGRLELAGQMLAPTNPFTSRVIVNRVWHHLFGRGLVASVDNFGVLGESPTHPELLDALADGFVTGGWSVKILIRSVVSSRAYKMSSRPDPDADVRDAGNRLWHRSEVRRLEAEPIRDAILAVSGRLDQRVGGPSVLVHLTPYMQGRGRPASGPLDGDGRRSLYLATRRNFLAPMMLTFDAPIPFNTVGRRNVSNVPAQALILMNDPFVIGQARFWAERSIREQPRPELRVAAMYREGFSRPPAEGEVAGALAFLESQAAEFGPAVGAWRDDARAWADFGHALMNDKEFVFIH